MLKRTKIFADVVWVKVARRELKHETELLSKNLVSYCHVQTPARLFYALRARDKSSSEDEIANVNVLRRLRTCRGQSLRPLN